jgi:hypothetical protein
VCKEAGTSFRAKQSEVEESVLKRFFRFEPLRGSPVKMTIMPALSFLGGLLGRSNLTILKFLDCFAEPALSVVKWAGSDTKCGFPVNGYKSDCLDSQSAAHIKDIAALAGIKAALLKAGLVEIVVVAIR